MSGSLSTRNFKLRIPLAFFRRNLSQTKHNTDHTSKHYLFHSSLGVITSNFKVSWLTIRKYMDKFIESRWQPNLSHLPWHYASLNDILSWWANVLLDGTRGPDHRGRLAGRWRQLGAGAGIFARVGPHCPGLRGQVRRAQLLRLRVWSAAPIRHVRLWRVCTAAAA